MDPIAIATSCYKLVKDIYQFKANMDADDEACSHFFERVNALSPSLDKLRKMTSAELGPKEKSLVLVNSTLENILKIISTRLKRNSSVFGWVKNAAQTYTGHLRASLDELNAELDRCRSDLQLCISIEADIKLDDIGENLNRVAAMLQNLTATTSVVETLYVIDSKTDDSDDENHVLGRGAFGKTVKMRNTVDNGHYAVKVIRVKEAEENGVSKNDLQREVLFLQKLNHPHIVRYFTSYFSSGNKKFNIVMELVTGGTLFKKVKDDKVTLTMIVEWWSQLASTLCYMHYDMKIQHRDIKPENILLTSRNTIKVIDLGLASAVKSSASKMSKVGTTTYFSFEKANGITYDGRDDVWAAGCVIAELMTKRRLLERGGPIYLYSNVEVNKRRLTLIDNCKAVDAGYGSIVERMLEPEQANRCNAREVAEMITHYQSTGSILKLASSVSDGANSTGAGKTATEEDVCHMCKQGFTFWNRRHHCRKCNLLVCGDHSKNRNDANQRVCDVCSRAALKAETDEIALEYYQGIFKKLPLNPRTIISRCYVFESALTAADFCFKRILESCVLDPNYQQTFLSLDLMHCLAAGYEEQSDGQANEGSRMKPGLMDQINAAAGFEISAERSPLETFALLPGYIYSLKVPASMTVLTGEVHIWVPGIEDSSSSFVKFVIEVTHGRDHWQTSRRYSDFEAFNGKLVEYGIRPAASLPGKMLITLEQRQIGLDQYLKAVVVQLKSANNGQASCALGRLIDDKFDALRLNKSKLTTNFV